MDKLATTELAPGTESPQSSAPQLANHKVKIKILRQRTCNERDQKNKLCGGHLKRWYYITDTTEQKCGDVERAWGRSAEVYRCEYCKTLYLPNPEDAKVNVAGTGRTSIFGFLPTAKDAAKEAAKDAK